MRTSFFLDLTVLKDPGRLKALFKYKLFNFYLNRVFKRHLEVNGIEPMTLCVQGRCSPS